jgi:uncharacterized protein (DUF983 family)
MDPFFLAVGQGRCPNCGQGPLFKSWLRLNDTCSVCGARFFRDPGNWTAPTAFGYGIGAASAVAAMVVMWFVNGLASGSELVIIGFAVAMTLATLRHVKAWWVAVLWRMGNVFPDPVRPDDATLGPSEDPLGALASDPAVGPSADSGQ